MTTREKFQAFFSHAGHDAKVDKDLIDHCSDELKQRVKSQWALDDFDVWRDRNEIHTGDDWKKEFIDAARTSDFLIVVLTPQWLQSPNCRAEYHAFRAVEKTRDGEYIIPILAREMKDQLPYLPADQREIYDDLLRRQYRKILAADFLTLAINLRLAEIEKTAGDIARMIARRKGVREHAARSTTSKPDSRTPAPVNARPAQFPGTDFLRRREVLIEKSTVNGAPRRLWAQADFFERLFVVEGDDKYFFGVHRATLRVANTGAGMLERNPNLESTNGNTYNINPDEPGLTIVTEPSDASKSLGEMAFSATEGENYYAEIGTVSPEVELANLEAKIEVSVCEFGLTFPDERFDSESPSLKKKLGAVLAQFIKTAHFDGGTKRALRDVKIRERDIQ